jgi:hypothetical protein
VPELAAAANVESHAGRHEGGTDLPGELAEGKYVGHVVASHVRSRDDRAGAVRERGPRELHAVRELGGTVVDARKEVKVDLGSWPLHRAAR